MSSTTETKQNQVQQQQTAPWSAAMPNLSSVLGNLSNYQSTVSPNANDAEQIAINALRANAQNTPNLAGQASTLGGQLATGGTDRTGILSGAYSNLQNSLNPIANQSLDPTQTPGIQSVLDTIRNDVSNQVNSQFAGAGRDLSGMNTQTLARGIAQGEAEPLLNQYNQNVAARQGAANSLFAGGAGTAAGLSGLDQTALLNKLQGLNVNQQIPTLQDMQANRILSAENVNRTLPLGNLQNINQLLLPIAQLGQSSQGVSQGTTSQTSPAINNLLSALALSAGITGKFFKPTG